MGDGAGRTPSPAPSAGGATGPSRRLRAGGVEVVVDGEGPRTLVFVHGWPDTLALWDPQVAALRSRFACARFTLPGFAPGDSSRARALDEVVATIAAVVDAVSPSRPVVLVLHDWGCFFGYRYAERHPDRVERLVGLDVGDAGSRANRREMGIAGQIGCAAYQLTLAAAWRVGPGLGDAWARGLARLFHAPDPDGARAAMGWPYAAQWFGAGGGFGRPRAFVPRCPMLYVHGLRKPFAFQSEDWLRHVAAVPGSRIVALPAGHWVMRHPAGAFTALLAEWLDASAPPAAAHSPESASRDPRVPTR